VRVNNREGWPQKGTANWHSADHSKNAYRQGMVVTVPDKRSRDLEVVVVRRIINLGTGNLEWGGNGKGLKKGRSVYE
jgi:hypothetical protein